MPATISPADLAEKLTGNEPVDLLDVRTPAEYRAVHVRGARLLPLDALDPEKVKAGRPDNAAGPTLVICKSGQRACKAAEQLCAAGMDIVLVEGGTDACVAAGLPVQRSNSGAVIALERQVRIAAGAMVFAGVLLGAFVHPWWLVVPAIVGAGLTFAGLTDTCAMGMVLAKMPWNR